MLQRIEAWRGSPRGIARFEEPLDAMELLPWLAAQKHPVKGYWSDRNGELEVAALGEADLVRGSEADGIDAVFKALNERWAANAGDFRYFGGFRFDTKRPIDDAWRPFGSYRFILPLAEIVRRGNVWTLACNLNAGQADAADSVTRCLSELFWTGRPESDAPLQPLGRKDEPDLAGWRNAIDAALQAIARADVEKVVLARRSAFLFPAPLDAVDILQRISRHTDRCSLFCGSYSGHVAFIGASPERLYRRTGRDIDSEAVAGTRRRGKTDAEDDSLGRELFASAKDRDEHDVVVRKVIRALQPLCESVDHSSMPTIVKLRHVQHLVTPIKGRLKEGVADAEVLRALHPTPAVGGEPSDAALAMIRNLEQFDRGWYAAPVGWIGRDAADFVVALRCGVVAGNALCLFSGAGIVAGSKAEDEWGEIENKMRGFLNLFS